MAGRYEDSYEYDDVIPHGLWEQIVKRAIEGKRGQAALREIEAALLAMPEHKLIDGYLIEYHDPDDGWPLEDQPGNVAYIGVCVVGALAMHRERADGKDWQTAARAVMERFGHIEDELDMHDYVAPKLKLTTTLVNKVARENDSCELLTPEERWEHMLGWVRKRIRPAEVASG